MLFYCNSQSGYSKYILLKKTSLFNSGRSYILIDYAYLAYAGQVLKDVFQKFSYNQVSPDSYKSVLYKIKTIDINLLAEELLNLSYGYVNDSPGEEFIYNELVKGFLWEVTREIILACPYFAVYKEFIKED